MWKCRSQLCFCDLFQHKDTNPCTLTKTLVVTLVYTQWTNIYINSHMFPPMNGDETDARFSIILWLDYLVGPVTDGTGRARYVHLHSRIIIPLISHLSHLRLLYKSDCYKSSIGDDVLVFSTAVFIWQIVLFNLFISIFGDYKRS